MTLGLIFVWVWCILTFLLDKISVGARARDAVA